MYSKGKLTSWNDEKGYGFITPNDGGKQVFIHAKGFYYRNKRPEINQLVTYTISQDRNGRHFAKEAAFGEPPERKNTPTQINAVTFIFPASFIFFIGFMALTTKLPMFVFYYYIAISLLSFFVYRIDKVSAQDGSQRTPENTLHLISLMGGWPGAIFAQQKFRHKTKKFSFLVLFWLTVVANCAGFLWLLTAKGLNFISNLLVSFT